MDAATVERRAAANLAAAAAVDAAAKAGMIRGGRSTRPDETDMRFAPGIRSCDGRVEETGLAPGMRGRPADGLVRLARRLAPMATRWKPGASSYRAASPAPSTPPPATFHVDFGLLGQITCSFGRET